MRVILLFLLLCFPLTASFSQPQEIKVGAQISDPYTWDFGKVKEGQLLKHDFILRNNSGKALTIKDVNTSCGCTVSKVEKKVLKRGESALIEVKFDSKGYSGQTQQFVYVNTDDLDNPVIRCIIKANVIK